MLAAAPAPVEALPAHRVALRAALSGVAGFFAAGLVALLLSLLAPVRQTGLLVVLTSAGGAVVAAFFTGAVELTRRVRPGGRLAALVAAGAVAPALATSALLYAFEFAAGKTPDRAWDEVMRWLVTLVSYPEVTAPAAAAVLLPFGLVGAAHAGGVPGALGRVLPFPVRLAVATATGAVGYVIVWRSYGLAGGDRLQFAGFALIPPALEVAIALAVALEAHLLARWARRGEAA
jgi:hypothetical protein